MLLSFISSLVFYICTVLASTSELGVRQSDGCTLTVFGYEVPCNITNGVPFPVKFCSSTYFKTSTNNIYFTWGFSNQTDGAIPLVSNMPPNVNNGYTFNATVSYSQSSLNRYIYLGVLETINDYYVPQSLHWYSKQVWISSS